MAYGSVEGDMTAGVHMERHDRIGFGRIAHKTVIHVDLSAQGERIGFC